MTAATDVRDDLGVAEWSVWTTTARVVVTDPAALDEARRLVELRLADVDAAASRFRPDSEVSRLAERGTGRPAEVSLLLARLVAFALCAAEQTGGDVDPTVGADLVTLGYDRDLALVPTRGTAEPSGRPHVRATRRTSYRDVRVDGTQIVVPTGVLLDLGATAKAWAADTCAVEVAQELGCGVLVSLGGDLRVAGPAPTGGWEILVQDGPDEPASHIRLRGADAVATSSTLHRVWSNGTTAMHHILDPRLRRPAAPVWRTATVAAPTCVEANTLATAAIVRGHAAIDLLSSADVAARLVAADGSVLRFGGWPE